MNGIINTNGLAKTEERQEKTAISDHHLQSADEIVNLASGKASAIAALPLPLADIAGVVYVQTRMVQDIAAVYNLKINDQQRIVLSNLLTVLLSKTVGSLAASLADQLKLTAIIKQGVIKAAVAAFFTKVTGDIYLRHIRGGHNLESLTPSLYLDYAMQHMASRDVSLDQLAQNAWSTISTKYI